MIVSKRVWVGPLLEVIVTTDPVVQDIALEIRLVSTDARIEVRYLRQGDVMDLIRVLQEAAGPEGLKL